MSSLGRLPVISLILLMASCHRGIPSEFEYPQGWITEEHSAETAGNLSGTVLDSSDAPRQFVLVERTTSDFETRLDATLTDERGRFRFHGIGKGTYYLRFRFRGFNDYLLRVMVVPGTMHDLNITLHVST